MIKKFQIFTLLSCLFTANSLLAEVTKETAQVDPQITTTAFSIGETITWQSKTLNQQRIINVYLPQNYHQNTQQKYPVIYLLDGSADEDFIHISGLVQFGSFSWIKMMPESIVVGIANVDRKHDMTYPSKIEIDQQEFPTSGGSEAFISFIEKDLKPLVNNKYRTQANTTLVGQSLGGLLATEVLIKHPDMFNNYLIVSPSLWWDAGALIKAEDALKFNHKSVFIAVGKEGPVMEASAKKLHEKLIPYETNQNRIGFQYFEKLDHGDTLHQAAYAGFKFIFENKTNSTQ